MLISVTVKESELKEMGVTTEKLKEQIIEDLDKARDYSGFNVVVYVHKGI